MRLALIDAGDPDTVRGVWQALEQLCADLAVPVERVEDLERADVLIWVQGDSLVEARELRARAAVAALHAAHDKLHVIPVMRQPARSKHLPLELQPYNAMQLDAIGAEPETWYRAIADEAVVSMTRGPSRRRVFLSYRRGEGSGAADQLYLEFKRRRFEVFLDVYSVDHGEDFEREIAWRLGDSDLMVALMSPGSGCSRWMRNEIALAKQLQVGIVGVMWPELAPRRGWARLLGRPLALHDQTVELARHFEPHLRVQLDARELRPARSRAATELTEGAIERVIACAYRNRANAQRARLESLVDRLRMQVVPIAGGPLVPVSPEVPGAFRVGKELHRVVPFRPSLELLHADARRWGSSEVERMFWYYQEARPDHHRTLALRWAVDDGARRTIVSDL